MTSPPTTRLIVVGQRYLKLATTLLQTMRVASSAGGVWEAADVQWWSRWEPWSDRDGQLFWLNSCGEPLAAMILNRSGHGLQCDVLAAPAEPGFRRSIWRAAIGRAQAIGEPVEFTVRQDDAAGIGELAAAGFSQSAEPGIVSSWLEASRRPAIPALAAGYRLVSRTEDRERPHWLAARSGPHVEERLRLCSLYRPELDLMVAAPDGQVAGYCLFWADPVTGVGLVEPMRTEEAHQRLGIANHLLATGLDLLAACGCQRLKVSSDIDLYLRAGFRPLPTATACTYQRTSRQS